jgi:hypothetical protein
MRTVEVEISVRRQIEVEVKLEKVLTGDIIGSFEPAKIFKNGGNTLVVLLPSGATFTIPTFKIFNPDGSLSEEKEFDESFTLPVEQEFEDVEIFKSDGETLVIKRASGQSFTIPKYIVYKNNGEVLAEREYDEPTILGPTIGRNTLGTIIAMGPSMEDLIIADQVAMQSGQQIASAPAGTPIIIPPAKQLSEYTSDELNEGLQLQQKLSIAVNRRIRSMPGSIPFDYGQAFYTLSYQNKFGTTSRFTALDGSQNYINDVILDHGQSPSGNPLQSVLGIRRTPGTVNITWDTAIANAATDTYLGKSWRLLAKREAEFLLYNAPDFSNTLTYPPFNFAGNLTIWLAEEVLSNTTTAFIILGATVVSNSAKTSNRRYLPCYEHIF